MFAKTNDFTCKSANPHNKRRVCWRREMDRWSMLYLTILGSSMGGKIRVARQNDMINYLAVPWIGLDPPWQVLWWLSPANRSLDPDTRWYWLTRGESRGFITRITIDVYFYDICKSIILANINDFVNIIVTILLLRELLHYLFTFNAEDVLTPN